MTDDRLDDLMASMAPISEAQVAELPLSGPETDLMEAIMSTSTTDSASRDPMPSETTPGHDAGAVLASYPLAGADGRGSGRRMRLVVAALAAAAAVLVATVMWPSNATKDDVDLAAKPQVAELSDDVTWILLQQPGWTMTGSVDAQRVTFTDGSHRLSIGQTPVLKDDPEPDSGFLKTDMAGTVLYDVLAPHQVLGFEAQVLQSREEQETTPWFQMADPAGNDEFIAQWKADGPTYQVGGELPTAEEFLQLLDALHVVDPDTFAAALPDSYVPPAEQPAVAEELLAGVSRPAGFDATELVVANSGIGQKRRNLVDAVASVVACGWVDSWIVATEAGDAEAAGQAVGALRTFLDAPIMDELEASPGSDDLLHDHYRVLVEEFADAMAEGRPFTLTGRGPAYEPIPGEPAAVRDVFWGTLDCFPPGDANNPYTPTERELDYMGWQDPPPG